MNLLIMRHAEATGNLEGRMQGQGSFPLTAKGQQQAQRLATHLVNLKRWPTAIYSSSLVRASQTTAILMQVLQAAPDETPIPSIYYREDLREFDHGILEGLTWTEAQQRYPDLCRQLEATSTWIPIPQAESLRSGRDRAERFFQDILRTHLNTDTLWIISHQWLMQYLIAVILGCDRTWQIPIHLTGLFEFELDRDRWWEPGSEAWNSTKWQIHRFNECLPHC